MGFGSKKMTHADGGMHHLGTKANDVAPVMILTAGMEQVADIAAMLEQPRQTGLYREYLTMLGSFRGKNVGVMSCGHGCMPMAIAVEELNHLGVGTIIKVGTGAALQKGIEPGTLIVPTAAVRGEGASLEYVPYEYPALANHELVGSLMKQASIALQPALAGICRSHDAFYAEYPPAGSTQQGIEHWRKLGVLLLEHELSSMFVVSSILGLRAAAVYTVEENLIEGSSATPEQLKERLEICYQLALETAFSL